MKKETLCFVAGHSGGHITPCLTRARNLLAHKSHNILFFSTSAPLDQKIICSAPIVKHPIFLSLIGTPKTNPLSLLSFILRFAHSFTVALLTLWHQRPTAIYSTGGLISVPVFLAGRLLRIPLQLHELNITPGRATRFLARFADTVWVAHRSCITALPNAQLAPYPVRFTASDVVDRATAHHELGLDPSRQTIFVLGGSQGSVFLNNRIAAFVSAHPHLHNQLQIVHQTGSVHAFDWHDFYVSRKFKAITFIYRNDLPLLYQAADLVICRAGAGTLAELNFFKKRSIVIPLHTTSTDHQQANAQTAQQENPERVSLLDQQEIERTPELFDQELLKQLRLAQPK